MTMEEKDAIKRYENRLKKFGDDLRVLGWRTKKTQFLRFEILSQIADLDGASVLDVGCGFGDIIEYFNKKNLKVDYTGWDVSRRLIEIAKQKFPNHNFEVIDVRTAKSKEKFDYVLSSGILNFKISDNYDYAKKVIKKCFRLCRRGVAINMMSDYVDFKADDLFYYSPEKIYAFSKSLTRRVALRSDYMPFEFTVYLYNNDAFDQERIFAGYPFK